ncbi:TfoX/Sxy family protein [Coralloluteibacterium stylophorae]|uniref:TfoX/Sxy family protein n=1 Tax=Coralloluteibacterium stylophorae TaxID=1776034 RepID=A0A8J8AXD2_9GAMM|nr:TfoX/Sxy family protein [Coralloluteibacterium stylophorae]MBS7458450.1 TfoX/Sxy family protein [Coralloluteibacterium stylophorae]
MRNVGPKSAAWLRQVGVRSLDDLRETGVVGAWLKCRRAGFRPGLNLLYALEGALLDCHWQDVPVARREQLVAEAEAGAAELPLPRRQAVFATPLGEARIVEGAEDAPAADARED